MTESISLTTTATDLPIAWDVLPVGRDRLKDPSAAKQLVLLPGRPGELMFRARNNSSQVIQLSLVVQGEFPRDWLSPRWRDVNSFQEGSWDYTLAPQTETSEGVTFTIPADFFERQDALAQNPDLTLRHQGSLLLYASTPTLETPKLVGYQTVDLYIRPIQSYLDFLPEIYQQSDFLGRFTTIFEQAFDPTLQTMEVFWAYLDPLTAPKGLLPFLAEWVAWPMNPRWTLKQQRHLIRHAVEIYQWRGTRKGLQLALSLVTGLPQDDQHIEIEEDYQADFVLGDIDFEAAPMLGGGRPFHFAITLRPATAGEHGEIDETVVRSLIEQEKPAFCSYDLIIEPVPNRP